MNALLHDFTFAIRTLRKSKAFSLIAIVTIALGIGASTAIFSVVNAVLLRPLPYSNPEQLALLQTDLAARKVYDFPLAPGDLPDIRAGAPLFAEIAAVTTNNQAVANDAGEPELVSIAAVTTNFMRTLGARVARGRDFVDADGDAPPPPPPNAPGGAALPAAAAPAAPQQQGPAQMVILSDGFWRRRFGADPQIVGKSIRIGRQTSQVIGVLEPNFELLWPASTNIDAHPDLYTALRIDFTNASRVNVFLRMVGRIKPNATFAQGQAQINRVVADLRKRFPIKETAGYRIRVEPMHDYLVAGIKPSLVALMGSVAFVLLIACANVANLLLVRASQRERDLAVRAALGSSRWALLRQMMVESLVLAGSGTVLGTALAWVGVRTLTANGPANLPRLEHVALDPVVMAFAVGSAVLAALVFGVVPAIGASRVDLANTLRTSGRNGALSNSGKLFRNGVVVAEVALAFVLLIGSGLMIRSFLALQRANPGFDTAQILMLQIPNQNQGRQDANARRAFMQELTERLSAIPGVTAVTAASPLPLENTPSNVRWGTEAALADPSLFQQADLRIVQPNYFTVVKTRVVDGRAFTNEDNMPALNRAIVDEVFAKKAFPGQSAVGKTVLARVGGPEPERFQIIGVVQHQRNETLAADGRETMYLSDGQFGYGGSSRWLLRTTGDPTLFAQSARSVVRQYDPASVVTELQPMSVLIDRARAPTRFALACVGLFAVVAAVLAAVGLYGVLSTVVRQRTAEIGVRMAFGASPAGVFQLVLKQGLALSALGIATGLFAAFGLTRLMSTMVVGVGTTDPATFVSMTIVFFAVAALACWLPARRAAGLEPLDALRED